MGFRGWDLQGWEFSDCFPACADSKMGKLFYPTPLFPGLYNGLREGWIQTPNTVGKNKQACSNIGKCFDANQWRETLEQDTSHYHKTSVHSQPLKNHRAVSRPLNLPVSSVVSLLQ